MSLKLQTSRGIVGVVGPAVDDIVQKVLESSLLDSTIPKFSSAPPPHHVTLISKTELQGLSKKQLASLPTAIDPDSLFVAGIGGNSSKGLFFVVIIWAIGQQLRKTLNLPPKHFHITLSDRNDHAMDKGIDSLLPGQFPNSPTMDFFDHLVFTLHAFGQFQREHPFCIDMILAFPDSHRGFLRLADAARLMEQPKLSMLSYAAAFERTSDEKVRGYCLKKLIDCSKYTEWEAVFMESEMSQLPEMIASMLLASWSAELRSHIVDRNITPILCLEPRERLYIPLTPTPTSVEGSFQKLPRNFRWIIPFHIAIMSTPR
jgi:atypical dual specificity phosphatase